MKNSVSVPSEFLTIFIVIQLVVGATVVVVKASASSLITPLQLAVTSVSNIIPTFLIVPKGELSKPLTRPTNIAMSVVLPSLILASIVQLHISKPYINPSYMPVPLFV